MNIEQQIMEAILPARTKSYTPIAHSSIIGKIENMCEENSLSIVDRSYQTSADYQQVTGKYTLNLKDDTMGCMIAFQNSYNKTMSVKFAIGASVFICSNGMVTGEHTIKRKHTGESDFELDNFITEAIDLSKSKFEDTIIMRDQMRTIDLSDNVMHGLIGEMFMYDNILRTEQITFLSNEYNNPTYDHGVEKNNLWNIYNLFTDSIERKSHPSLYFKQHQKVTETIHDKFFA